MSKRIINVDYLTRVEGEGSLYLKISDGKVEEAKLKIFEPPRFFEAFLRGRHFLEAPDITARICGICPVAYLMSSCQAMEDICGVKVDGQLRELRRLLYFGEWIESHALHIFMLHAPDFLGYQDAIQMAKDHPELVKNALRLKKLGNDLMKLIGGREIHPINVKVGGFYKIPSRKDLLAFKENLKWAETFCYEAIKLIATLPCPDFEQDYEFVCLQHPEEYPILDGKLISNKGMDVPISEYDEVLIEGHIKHSTSLHTHIAGRGPAHVGPLARYSLNFNKLGDEVQQTALDAGLREQCTNPFQSILVRAVELLYAVKESLRIIDVYEQPDSPSVEVIPRAGTGYGCTEAPRGICYHRYSIDDNGLITDAKIVAPTSINQATIERDLYHFATAHVGLSDEKLQWQCEQAIRNYDPCISCSCHFLKLKVDRD